MAEHSVKTEKEFEIGGIVYRFSCNGVVEIDCAPVKVEEGVTLLRVGFEWTEEQIPEKISLFYRIPCVDLYTMWDPLKRTRDLEASWRAKSGRTESRLASGMPLKGLISRKGLNRYLLAVSDVKNPLSIKMGAHGQFGTEDVTVDFFTTLCGPFRRYEALLRIDERSIPFDRAIFEARHWYDELGYPSAYSPALAKQPMYSTWYSLWQDVTAEQVLRECAEAVKYGMKTVIVDDGWQTDVSGVIYGYCGDWKPTEKKFPDMRGMVDRLHAMGMKVMIWFTVPYMGHFSENYKTFEGYYLEHRDASNCSVLDPRYKHVREFMVNTYADAVKRWDLDGLKLDFIDRFVTNGQVGEGMDFLCVEDAVEQLLREIYEALTAINPDILIEFRQPYFGPVVGTYGNMMRVWDCPLDSVTNKNQSLNLRLISSDCAVHSDMIYWHWDDTAESVAVQLLGTLFSVPQISVRFAELNEAHKTVLRRYLDFWSSHADTLMSRTLSVRLAENGYSYASAVKNGEKIALAMTRAAFEMETEVKEGYLFNITDEESIILRTEGEGRVSYEVFDCLGKRVGRRRTVRGRLCEVTVPIGGMLKVTRT